jgi:hypothetical protein
LRTQAILGRGPASLDDLPVKCEVCHSYPI